MTLRRRLRDMADAIADEAERNPAFREAIERVLRTGLPEPSPPTPTPAPLRRRRETPALDPVAVARESEASLRRALAPLTLDQLHDIVAAHQMNTKGLVLRWKTSAKVADEIVRVALLRRDKGIT